MDLYLDPTTHDLVIQEGQLRTTAGIEEIKQRCKVALLAVRGEWDFNLGFGFPRRQIMATKPARPAAIRAAAVQTLKRVRGVTEVVSCSVSIDERSREATINATVKAGAITVGVEV